MLMRNLETNDCLLLNNIIYQVYTVDDLETMLNQVFERLKLLIDYQRYDYIMDVADEVEYHKTAAASVGHSLRLILEYNKEFVGVVTIYRDSSENDFSYDDVFVLDLLKDHLSYRFYKHRRAAENVNEKLSVREAAEKYQLTRQEENILGYLMAGMDSTTICETLVIAENTLKKHILNIYRKLGINNRVSLFKMILENA